MRSRVIHQQGGEATERPATERLATTERSAGTTEAPSGSARPQVAERARAVLRGGVGLVRFPGAAPLSSSELWVGVHLSEAAEEPVWQGLERLAVCAQRFTPRVSLVPPDGLVLEVKGSLHLFGGAEALRRALEDECRAVGVKPVPSLAPFPLAALAAARAGKTFVITQPAHLIGRLTSLPLTTLRWDATVLHRLRQIGVYTI